MTCTRGSRPCGRLSLRTTWGLFLVAVMATLFGGIHPACAASLSALNDSIDLAELHGHVQLVNQLSMLEDRGGQLDVKTALAQRGWQQATPALLNRGFTASAFWLRGTLYNSSDRAVTRWLSVGVVRLEDIRYYRLASDGVIPRETIFAGNRMPLDSRPIRAAMSVFPVTFAPGERIGFALRIQSRSAASMDVELWTPNAFREDEERGAMGEMLMTGSMMTIALYTLILGIARRDRVFLLLAGSVITDVIYDLAFRGYLYRYVLSGGGELVLRAPSVIPAITTALFSAMAVAFAGLDRIAYWKWTYRTLICACCLSSIWTALGDYRTSAGIAVSAVFLCNVVWVISMIDGWRRGFPNARLFLLAFAVDCTTLFLRLASICGLLPEKWGIGTGIAWDNLSVLLMMVLIVAGRSRQLQREQHRTQQALLDERTRVQEHLERAVGERTHELQAALIAADEANSAKSDFLARISHDLRTPLTSIIGFADLIHADGREDAERGSIIRRSAAHMLTMVNDLIDYAAGGHPGALSLAPVYTHALLNSIAQESASFACKHGNRFVLDLHSNLPPILELDEKRVRQVIGNLIDNAIKFTSAGTITLSVATEEKPTTNTSVELLFSVTDTGCGIATEDQHRIFEPFLRLDAAKGQPGIGLGLAIVQHWVAQMSGSLSVESAPGAGTTVRVILPTRAIEEAQVAPQYISDASGALPSIDGSGRCIWIAEDTDEIRQFLSDELSNLGFTVDTAPDGNTLIERISRIGTHGPDLVLTDHMMPGQEGAAVLAAVRRHVPAIPVVALSATPQAVREAAGQDVRGYDACLLKPVNLAELRNTLARLLDLPHKPPVRPSAQDNRLNIPSAETLADVRRLITLGAISDLIDWAEDLAARAPECASFALQLRRLARLGDLVALQSLCDA